MRGRPALALGLVLAFGPVASSAGASPPWLADCPNDYSTTTTARKSAACLFREARRLGRWDEAAELFTRQRQAPDSDPWLDFYAGRVELERGSEGAGAVLRSAAEGFAIRGEAAGEAYAQINRFLFFSRRGRAVEAGAALDEAAAAAARSGDQRLLNDVQLQRARHLRRQGVDLARAHRDLLALEEGIFAEGPYSLRLSWLHEMGTTLFELGRAEEATAYFQREAELALEANDPGGESAARYSLLMAHLAQPSRPGIREKGIVLAEAALAAAQAGGALGVEAKSRLVLGRLLGGEVGVRHFEACIALAEKLSQGNARSGCEISLAALRVDEDPSFARTLLERATARQLENAEPWSVYGWSDRMRTRWAILSRDEAATSSMAELGAIEFLRGRQTAEAGRMGLLAAWSEVYYALVGRLLASPEPSRGDLERAFEVTERLRARQLLDALEVASVQPELEAEDPLAKRRSEVLTAIGHVQRRLLDPRLGADEKSASRAELGRLELMEAEIDEQLVRRNPLYKALRSPPIAALAKVEQQLGAEEALLSFVVAPEETVFGQIAGGSWLLVITRQGSRAVPLGDGVGLEARARVFTGLLLGRDPKVEAPAIRLFELLLARALAGLPASVERLVLVPDGALHHLPFAALRAGPDTPPLAAAYQLEVAPSATLWLRWQQAQARPAGAVLALADPERAASSLALPGVDTLGPLRFARREGRRAVRSIGGSSRLLAGEQATETALKTADLAPFGILHFAAHALVDGGEPRRSAILLEAGGEQEDGLLQPREIVGLGLTGRVVVLSACRSAGGQILRGEGVMSLARAFFQAGAQTVVGSLWPLRDDEAAELLTSFYRRLGEGESVAAALAEAQREQLAAGAPAAAWAGVVVLGNGGVVPLPGGRSTLWPWLLSLWLLLPVVVLAAAASRYALRRSGR